MTDSDTDSTETTDRRGPLTDVRVVDLTQMLAGPYATMLLADMGADVIKIEPPDGDSTRDNPPHRYEDEAYGGYFHSVNRNKRSIVIDLKTEKGKETLKGLIRESDVFVENYRKGTMENLDLSYETLREENPALVYASIRGFGDNIGGESPYNDRPAYDVVAQAMGGMMSITGTEESGPLKVGPGVGDIFPAALAAFGILSAQHHSQRTGDGQYVDVSMVDSILSLTERIVHQYAFEGRVPEPQGKTHPILFPFGRYEASDGYVMIAAPSSKQWRALCEHMGRPKLGRKYDDKGSRQEHIDDLRPVVEAWVAQHTKAEIFEILAEDVPCGPVNTAEDIFADPHFAAREMLPAIEHADTGEEVQVAGTPIKLSETPGGVARRAPLLGEHTEDILREFGLDNETIAERDTDGTRADRSSK